MNSSQEMLSTRSTCDGPVRHGHLDKNKTVGLTKEIPVRTPLSLTENAGQTLGVRMGTNTSTNYGVGE